MTDPTDPDAVARIAAGLSAEQRAMFMLYEPGIWYGTCCPHGVTPGAKRGWARRDLITVVHRNLTTFHADYALTPLGLAVREHLERAPTRQEDAVLRSALWQSVKVREHLERGS